MFKELSETLLEKISGGVDLSNENLDECECADAANSPDNSVNRFRRKSDRGSIIEVLRKREHYEKPTVRRIKRTEAPRGRKIR